MNTDIANSIARKMLASGVLDNPDDYIPKGLFRIRDAVNMLLDYFPNEKWLLDLKEETLQFITQKVGE